jgi:SM-20-related protein
LRGDGWLVLPQFLPALWCEALLADCQVRREQFANAAVGRGNQRQHLSDQRRDATLWLSDDVAVQRDYLIAMDKLRSEINRQLFLGLRDYEAHYAHYASGAFYRRHYDAFAHTSSNGSWASNNLLESNHSNMPRRVLTTVVYLNTSAGGELVIGDDEREIACVAPVAGTAVFFMSAEFPHEVLPAQSDRYSISGWFRT